LWPKKIEAKSQFQHVLHTNEHAYMSLTCASHLRQTKQKVNVYCSTRCQTTAIWNQPQQKAGAKRKLATQPAAANADTATPAMRDAMLEWLAMDRDGQKDGQSMQNWRSIYGGAAKGRSMNDDAEDVHAKGNYKRLADFVNTKCKIKSDKLKAWDEELAEKRWQAMKKSYRKACKNTAPINTAYATEDEFKTALAEYKEKQEKECPGFSKLHAMLAGHPATHPFEPHDSMAMPRDKQEDGRDDAQMLPTSNTLGIKRRAKGSVTKQKKEKKEFHLRKPGTETATAKRMSLHQMFIESQNKQTAIEKQKLLVDAIGKLAQAGIKPADMPAYLTLMQLSPSPTKLSANASPRSITAGSGSQAPIAVDSSGSEEESDKSMSASDSASDEDQ
jgi:hypothetical protein